MKNKMSGMMAAVLSAVLAAGMLTGCGNTDKLDGTMAAATVNGEKVSMGLLSLHVRQEQAYMESLYNQFFGSAQGIWEAESDEEGVTQGEHLVQDVLNEIETMYLMKAHAADYNVELPQEDLDAAAQYAAQFMADNTEETLADLAVSEEDVRTMFELQLWQKYMEPAIKADADPEVSDEEAQQSSFTYVQIDLSGLEEEEAQTARENAQTLLDKWLEDPEADMDLLTAEVDDSLMANMDSFSVNPGEEETDSYPGEVMSVLRSLEEGVVYGEIVEAEDSLYLLRMDTLFDESATESRRHEIIHERENKLLEEVTEGWKSEASITVDEKVLSGLKVEGTHTFTIITPEEEIEAEEGLEAETETEAAEEDAEAETEIETESVEEEAEEEAAE